MSRKRVHTENVAPASDGDATPSNSGERPTSSQTVVEGNKNRWDAVLSSLPKSPDPRDVVVGHTVSLVMLLTTVVIGVPLWWMTTTTDRPSDLAAMTSRMTELSTRPIELYPTLTIVDVSGQQWLTHPDLVWAMANNALAFTAGVNTLRYDIRFDKPDFDVTSVVNVKSFKRGELARPIVVVLPTTYSGTLISSSALYKFYAEHEVIVMRGPSGPTDNDFLMKRLRVAVTESFIPPSSLDSVETSSKDGIVMSNVAVSPATTSIDVYVGIMAYHPNDVLKSGCLSDGFHVKDILQRHPIFGRVVERLRSISGFKIQLKSHRTFGVRLPESVTRVFKRDQLVELKTSMATHLTSYVSSASSSLHLIAYVNGDAARPLQMADNAESYTIARWGGVQFVNPSISCDEKTRRGLETRMVNIWLTQLLELVGFDVNVADGVGDGIGAEDIILTDMFAMRWQAKRLADNLRIAKENVNSLLRLTDDVPNIQVDQQVAQLIRSSINSIEQYYESGACNSAVTLQELSACYRFTLDALRFSEKSFYHASLLGLLYFPQDQKYAIYVPLFIPIGLPILTAGKSTVLWLWKEKGGKVLAETWFGYKLVKAKQL